MNGNTPYAGLPGVTGAGRRALADKAELSPEKKRHLQRETSRIAARTRELLPDEYIVNAGVTRDASGPRATVAVSPPAGNPVSAGVAPADLADGGPDPEDREEVARGLAASAALQVKQAISGNVTPTGR